MVHNGDIEMIVKQRVRGKAVIAGRIPLADRFGPGISGPKQELSIRTTGLCSHVQKHHLCRAGRFIGELNFSMLQPHPPMHIAFRCTSPEATCESSRHRTICWGTTWKAGFVPYTEVVLQSRVSGSLHATTGGSFFRNTDALL